MGNLSCTIIYIKCNNNNSRTKKRLSGTSYNKCIDIYISVTGRERVEVVAHYEKTCRYDKDSVISLGALLLYST